MQLGSAGLRLHFSSFSKEGLYGTVSRADRGKGEQLVAAAIAGLAAIFEQSHAKVIPVRTDHHRP